MHCQDIRKPFISRYSTVRPLSTLNYTTDMFNNSSIVSGIEFDKVRINSFLESCWNLNQLFIIYTFVIFGMLVSFSSYDSTKGSCIISYPHCSVRL
jgi:hypothetical protein